MNKIWFAIILLILFVPAFVAAEDEDPPWSDWTFRAPIDFQGDNSLIRLNLPPTVLDNARPDLADLRVIERETGREVPYVSGRYDPPKYRRVDLVRSIYNRAYVPRKSATVTVDFGRTAMKNNIEIETEGNNFRRRVLIESSDDEKNWKVVTYGAFLFRIGPPGHIFNKNKVYFTDNNQRYMRITVYNGQDDPPKLNIADVDAWYKEYEPTKMTDYQTQVLSVTQDEKKKSTLIELDVNYNNLPCNEIKLEIGDENFYRRVIVEARDAKTHIVHKMTETGPKDVEEEARWMNFGSGYVYRINAEGLTEEKLVLPFARYGLRYVRLSILNNDDQPLEFRNAQLRGYPKYIDVHPKNAGPLSLLYGNPKAKAPAYDLAHFVDKLRKDGFGKAELGLSEQLTPGPREDDRPWSERNSWLIWVVLILILGVLAGIVYFQIQSSAAKK